MFPIGLNSIPIKIPYVTIVTTLLVLVSYKPLDSIFKAYRSEVSRVEIKYGLPSIYSYAYRKDCRLLVLRLHEKKIEKLKKSSTDSNSSKKDNKIKLQPLSAKEVKSFCGKKLTSYYRASLIIAGGAGQGLSKKEQSNHLEIIKKYQKDIGANQADMSKLYFESKEKLSAIYHKGPVKAKKRLLKMRAEIMKLKKKYNLIDKHQVTLLGSLKASMSHGSLSHLFGNLFAFIAASVFLEVKIGSALYSIISMVFALFIPFLATKLPIGSSLWMHNSPVLIGFSGSVSAVWGMYWVFFNKRLSRFIIPLFSIPIVTRLKTVIAIPVVFILTDLVGLINALAGNEREGNVSFEAHLSGFALGLIIAYVYKSFYSMDEDIIDKSELSLLMEMKRSTSLNAIFDCSKKLYNCNWQNIVPSGYFLVHLTEYLIAQGQSNYLSLDKEQIHHVQNEYKRLLTLSHRTKNYKFLLQVLQKIPTSFELYKYTGNISQTTLIGLINYFKKANYQYCVTVFSSCYLQKYGASNRNNQIIVDTLKGYLSYGNSRDQILSFIESWSHKALESFKDQILDFQARSMTSNTIGTDELKEDTSIIPRATSVERMFAIVIDWFIIILFSYSLSTMISTLSMALESYIVSLPSIFIVSIVTISFYFFSRLASQGGTPGMLSMGIQHAKLNGIFCSKEDIKNRFLFLAIIFIFSISTFFVLDGSLLMGLAISLVFIVMGFVADKVLKMEFVKSVKKKEFFEISLDTD